ncbi:ABC transporter ATP-binding protein [Listeria sp. FSL L7-1582]|uniref:ABC transporter ATP-binding protein n=1 Tax=Listeria portnoyi TaxID=2713504 RepID=UPI00164E1558|nr:ABC transporter ATP-binding protein [Listeria portnoyi]MBC6310801.1 ABC transporter ATP-binding protein [Listeria portnoyi]
MEIIRAENITKRFENETILHGVSLALRQGEKVTILGGSGSGKTTFLKVLAGLLSFDSGSYQKSGVKIAYISQKPVLFSHMTVLENLIFPLKCQKVKRKEREAIGRVFLEKSELAKWADAYPFELSGGQQQRVSVARALIGNPDLLLMDEPFSSLDVRLGRDMRQWVFTQIEERKMAAVFVTHHYEEAKVFSERVLLMEDGVLKEATDAEIDVFFGDGLLYKDVYYPIGAWRMADSGVPVQVERQVMLYGQAYWSVILEDGAQKFIIVDENRAETAYIAPVRSEKDA